MTTTRRIATWIIFGAMLLITMWINNGFPEPAHSATYVKAKPLHIPSYNRHKAPKVCLVLEGCR